MKFILIGLSLSLISLILASAIAENGHAITVGFMFAIFFFPALIISILNGIFLKFLETIKLNLMPKRIASLIPILILILISFSNQSLPFLDAKAAFLGIFGSVSIGSTNLYWIYQLKVEFQKTNDQVFDN